MVLGSRSTLSLLCAAAALATAVYPYESVPDGLEFDTVDEVVAFVEASEARARAHRMQRAGPVGSIRPEFGGLSDPGTPVDLASGSIDFPAHAGRQLGYDYVPPGAGPMWLFSRLDRTCTMRTMAPWDPAGPVERPRRFHYRVCPFSYLSRLEAGKDPENDLEFLGIDMTWQKGPVPFLPPNVAIYQRQLYEQGTTCPPNNPDGFQRTAYVHYGCMSNTTNFMLNEYNSSDPSGPRATIENVTEWGACSTDVEMGLADFCDADLASLMGVGNEASARPTPRIAVRESTMDPSPDPTVSRTGSPSASWSTGASPSGTPTNFEWDVGTREPTPSRRGTAEAVAAQAALSGGFRPGSRNANTAIGVVVGMMSLVAYLAVGWYRRRGQREKKKRALQRRLARGPATVKRMDRWLEGQDGAGGDEDGKVKKSMSGRLTMAVRKARERRAARRKGGAGAAEGDGDAPRKDGAASFGADDADTPRSATSRRNPLAVLSARLPTSRKSVQAPPTPAASAGGGGGGGDDPRATAASRGSRRRSSSSSSSGSSSGGSSSSGPGSGSRGSSTATPPPAPLSRAEEAATAIETELELLATQAPPEPRMRPTPRDGRLQSLIRDGYIQVKAPRPAFLAMMSATTLDGDDAKAGKATRLDRPAALPERRSHASAAARARYIAERTAAIQRRLRKVTEAADEDEEEGEEGAEGSGSGSGGESRGSSAAKGQQRKRRRAKAPRGGDGATAASGYSDYSGDGYSDYSGDGETAASGSRYSGAGGGGGRRPAQRVAGGDRRGRRGVSAGTDAVGEARRHRSASQSGSREPRRDDGDDDAYDSVYDSAYDDDEGSGSDGGSRYDEYEGGRNGGRYRSRSGDRQRRGGGRGGGGYSVASSSVAGSILDTLSGWLGGGGGGGRGRAGSDASRGGGYGGGGYGNDGQSSIYSGGGGGRGNDDDDGASVFSSATAAHIAKQHAPIFTPAGARQGGRGGRGDDSSALTGSTGSSAGASGSDAPLSPRAAKARAIVRTGVIMSKEGKPVGAMVPNRPRPTAHAARNAAADTFGDRDRGFANPLSLASAAAGARGVTAVPVPGRIIKKAGMAGVAALEAANRKARRDAAGATTATASSDDGSGALDADASEASSVVSLEVTGESPGHSSGSGGGFGASSPGIARLPSMPASRFASLLAAKKAAAQTPSGAGSAGATAPNATAASSSPSKSGTGARASAAAAKVAALLERTKTLAADAEAPTVDVEAVGSARVSPTGGSAGGSGSGGSAGDKGSAYGPADAKSPSPSGGNSAGKAAAGGGGAIPRLPLFAAGLPGVEADPSGDGSGAAGGASAPHLQLDAAIASGQLTTLRTVEEGALTPVGPSHLQAPSAAIARMASLKMASAYRPARVAAQATIVASVAKQKAARVAGGRGSPTKGQAAGGGGGGSGGAASPGDGGGHASDGGASTSSESGLLPRGSPSRGLQGQGRSKSRGPGGAAATPAPAASAAAAPYAGSLAGSIASSIGGMARSALAAVTGGNNAAAGSDAHLPEHIRQALGRKRRADSADTIGTTFSDYPLPTPVHIGGGGGGGFGGAREVPITALVPAINVAAAQAHSAKQQQQQQQQTPAPQPRPQAPQPQGQGSGKTTPLVPALALGGALGGRETPALMANAIRAAQAALAANGVSTPAPGSVATGGSGPRSGGTPDSDGQPGSTGKASGSGSGNAGSGGGAKHNIPRLALGGMGGAPPGRIAAAPSTGVSGSTGGFSLGTPQQGQQGAKKAQQGASPSTAGGSGGSPGFGATGSPTGAAGIGFAGGASGGFPESPVIGGATAALLASKASAAAAKAAPSASPAAVAGSGSGSGATSGVVVRQMSAEDISSGSAVANPLHRFASAGGSGQVTATGTVSSSAQDGRIAMGAVGIAPRGRGLGGGTGAVPGSARGLSAAPGSARGLSVGPGSARAPLLAVKSSGAAAAMPALATATAAAGWPTVAPTGTPTGGAGDGGRPRAASHVAALVDQWEEVVSRSRAGSVAGPPAAGAVLPRPASGVGFGPGAAGASSPVRAGTGGGAGAGAAAGAGAGGDSFVGLDGDDDSSAN